MSFPSRCLSTINLPLSTPHRLGCKGASPLSVTVDQSAITVEFLNARSRFTNPNEAVGLIRELIEETVIVETWFGPDSTDCSFVNVNALPPGYKVSGVTRIVRHSWRGKHDADENMA